MDTSANILVYFAHLDIERSVINCALCDAIRDLPQVNFRDLHELYPDFYIDAFTEQTLLKHADLVVFQHPIYWYAAPAVFKHFLDTVWVRGFAYGKGGSALQGKDFMLAVSTGAPEHEYRAQGIHQHAFHEFVRPIEQTVRFCGMHFLEPMVLHGGHSLPCSAIEAHAARYRRTLEAYQPNTNR